MSLERFIEAQKSTYESALSEVQAASKQTHWMWFIFPQLKGLGQSNTAQFYGIADLNEAKEFLRHPLLGNRLIEITQTLLSQPNRDVHKIFGSPDDMKLHSSLTLFAEAADAHNSVFKQALTAFFDGKKDDRTIKMLENRRE